MTWDCIEDANAAAGNATPSLMDLDPDQGIEITREGMPTIYTTVRELIEVDKLPAFLTLDQVELVFSE
jgi:hypothetical protein